MGGDCQLLICRDVRLYAKCIPCFTDCTIAELEKLGPKYRLALRVAKDPRWTRLQCDHKGTYADDCIVDRVSFLSPAISLIRFFVPGFVQSANHGVCV